MRELLEHCSLDHESAAWVKLISETTVAKPPYRQIINTIEKLQKKYRREAVRYSALRIELGYLTPPINYETDSDLADLCKGMAQMAPEAMFASDERVELEQSADNVIAEIETATREYL